MKQIGPVLIFDFVAASFLPKHADVLRNRFASTRKTKKPIVILSDVNETLLDMSPLKKNFEVGAQVLLIN